MEIKHRYNGKMLLTIEGASLEGASLEGASLEGASLEGASLEGANLRGANLRGADLRGADLRGADLYGASLEGADLYRADLEGSKYREDILLKYLSIGPIGSRRDYLQVFITDKQTMLKTGCFTGSVEELTNRTEREDYQTAITFIKQLEKGLHQ